jgi:hypothetical protein
MRETGFSQSGIFFAWEMVGIRTQEPHTNEHGECARSKLWEIGAVDV